MLRLLHGTKLDFIKWWKHMAVLTAVWILIGVALFFQRGKGFNYSIDFTGGTLMQVSFAKPTTDEAVRAVTSSAGYSHAEIQRFGSDSEYTIRARAEQASVSTDSTRHIIERALKAQYGETGVKVLRGEFVGAKVGDELQRNAIIAVLISFIVTLIYLAIRFEWRFGLAATFATAHDILTTLAFIMMLHI